MQKKKAKKADPAEIRAAELARCKMLFTHATIRRLLREKTKAIKAGDGVYDEEWCKLRDDLARCRRLLASYDKFLDEQGVYHSSTEAMIDGD